MALRRIQDSLGSLKEDLLQIAIDRFGQEEWDNVISKDEISKQKVESYVNEQMIAMQAFLHRQRFSISDMKAFGEISPRDIRVAGGGVTGNTAVGGGPILPGATLGRGITGFASNNNDVEISVQISEEDPGYGPKVKRQVKRSEVRLFENIGMSK
tara:strand:+ start:36 stop:500 length:465 start_codon:yes stop_codon:yes gene_type:complete